MGRLGNAIIFHEIPCRQTSGYCSFHIRMRESMPPPERVDRLLGVTKRLRRSCECSISRAVEPGPTQGLVPNARPAVPGSPRRVFAP